MSLSPRRGRRESKKFAPIDDGDGDNDDDDDDDEAYEV